MNGERLTLWWVDRYTRGVPESEREARRAEIESDLWEQGAALAPGRAGASHSRLGACVGSPRPQPAPVTSAWTPVAARTRWRWPEGIGWALSGAAYAFLGLTHGLLATALVGVDLYGDDWAPGDVESTSRFGGIMLGLLLAAERCCCHRAPRLSAGACWPPPLSRRRRCSGGGSRSRADRAHRDDRELSCWPAVDDERFRLGRCPRRAERSRSVSCRRECPSPRARPSSPRPCPTSPR